MNVPELPHGMFPRVAKAKRGRTHNQTKPEKNTREETRGDGQIEAVSDANKNTAREKTR